jgi:hypothetical protein
VHGTGRALMTAIVSGVALAGLATTCLAASDTWPVTLAPGSNAETAATGLTVTGVTAQCAGTNRVTVSWNAIAVPAGYRVWEQTGTGAYVTVATNLTTATWASTPLGPGTYRFEVSAGSWHSWTSDLSTPTTAVVVQTTTPTCTVG